MPKYGATKRLDQADLTPGSTTDRAGFDIRFYAAAVLVVISVGLLACWIPAYRAASVAPLDAWNSDSGLRMGSPAP